ncbi:MAG: hypothetical protein PVJ43_10825, partial [Gemmatimonadales bacterium]
MATILITTADLEAAGKLQAAFEPVDDVTFVTDAHDVRSALGVADVTQAALVVTGAVRDQATRAVKSQVLERLPSATIVALLPEGERVSAEVAAALELDESFVKPF